MGGSEGLCAAAAWASADLVVTGIVGCAGLLPTLAAIRAGKDLALANKETLIAAGPVVLPELQKSGSRLLPADSEHSALFQCLQGTPWADTARLSTGVPTPGLRRIQLTASGGAFRDWPAADLAKATVADATSHPNWSMGRKITVDSATLMNKGLEVIEAHYLFGLDYDHIEIVIHPQSIIHSMVELADTSVLAQLGWPDMRLPLLYCLSWPERLETPWRRLDLTAVGQLTFRAPDSAKYPCMALAYAAGRAGGTMPAVLNAANEQAVALFLEEAIPFLAIPQLIERVCDRHRADHRQRSHPRRRAGRGRLGPAGHPRGGRRTPQPSPCRPAGMSQVQHHLLLCATPSKPLCGDPADWGGQLEPAEAADHASWAWRIPSAPRAWCCAPRPTACGSAPTVRCC